MAAMRKMLSAALLVPLLLLPSCGTNVSINGGWNAQLLNPDGSIAFTFFTDFKQSTGGGVTVLNFSLGTATVCFNGSPLSESATFRSGQFTMTLSTVFPMATNNVLNLQGTQQSDGTIQGTWKSSGNSVCNANGTFTLTGVPPV